MSLKLIADHISRYGNSGSSHTSYISSTICEEFIGFMARKDMNTIKSAKFFLIIGDSMPDISYTDQLTFIIRYVQKNGARNEWIQTFIPKVDHKALETTGYRHVG